MNKRAMFKDCCPSLYAKLEELAKTITSHGCFIALGKKHVRVEVTDPYNEDGTLVYNLNYHTGIEAEINAIIEEADSMSRTFYRPLYIGFTPTVKLELKNVELQCDDTGAYLMFADGRSTEPFGYNHEDHERFVARIIELLSAAKGCPTEEGTKDKSDYTKDLWGELDEEAKQRFLDKMTAEGKTSFLQKIEKTED